jgi:two-component system, cell cycle response regulator
MNILIADHSKVIRTIIREELEKAGYTVFTAADEKEFFEVLKDFPVDLATLPVEFSPHSGYDIASVVHSNLFYTSSKNKSGKEVPVIFITGNDSVEGRRKGFESGGADFIAKPFTEGDVLRAVNNLLIPETRLKGMTALAIDDSPLARNIVRKYLVSIGVVVHEASDGLEGYAKIQEMGRNLDIVITDFMMPGIRGDELCFKVRKELNLPDLPIVVLSGVKDSDAILQMFRAGATDYMIKPFIKEELLGRITAHLENRMLHSKLQTKIYELDEMNQVLRKTATVDSLTGLYNRKYFLERLDEAVSRLHRYQHNMTLIIMDLDHFKDINDNFGHQTGDRILQRIASLIQKAVRRADFTARLGGEKFGILAPGTDQEGAKMLTKKLLRIVTSGRYNIKGTEVRLSACIGVTSLSEGDTMNTEQVFQKTETRLLKAKSHGKSSICC